jgi:hypothetical protein
MKLQEVFADPSFGRGGKIMENCLRMNEVFDTRIPVDNWVHTNNGEYGDISIDDTDYRIELEFLSYPINGSEIEAVNIAFGKVVNGISTGELTLDTKNTSKVFGAILNAALDKIKEYNFDAILFMAANNIEKRMQLYNRLARWVAKSYSYMIPNIPVGNGVMTIVCNKHITKEDVDIITKHFNEKNR